MKFILLVFAGLVTLSLFTSAINTKIRNLEIQNFNLLQANQDLLERDIEIQKPSIQYLIFKHFGPKNYRNALKIATCESQLNPRSISKTHDYGIFQIHNGLALYGKKIFNPEFNIKLAYTNYFKKRGWEPWACARKVVLD